MAKTAVVILNWNGKSFLEKFLPGVVENSPNAEVVVADNASTDDSVAWVEKNHPEVTIVQLDKNEGFCRGYNLALKQIEADYYVLLNSDVEVTPNWLEPKVKLLDENPDIAACQPKIRAYHEKESFEYAGGAGGYIDRYGFPLCRGRLFQSLEKDNGQYDDSREIFWATGACMTIRSEVFHELGGFDERFFAHMEEIDLCWRIQNLGKKIFYCSDSLVYHVGGGTLSASNPKKTYLNFRNGLFLLAKNLPKRQFLQTIFPRMVLDGIAGVKFILSGAPKDTWAIFKAHMAFYGSLPSLPAIRKKIGRKKHFPYMNGVLGHSIVYKHFVNKKNTFSEL